MIFYLIRGIILGTSAGISPGPLLALLVSETLQHDYKAGIKVAIAPLVTDAPIIALCLFMTKQISNHPFFFGLLACGGAVYLFTLAIHSVRTTSVTIDCQRVKSRSLLKGIVTNWLNPHPYLFWITVGSAIMWQALSLGRGALFLFFGGFYSFLVGSKIGLALAIGASKKIVTGKGLVRMTQLMGIVLFVFAILLGYEGVSWLVRRTTITFYFPFIFDFCMIPFRTYLII